MAAAKPAGPLPTMAHSVSIACYALRYYVPQVNGWFFIPQS